MKIKDGFELRKVAGTTVVVPLNEDVDFTDVFTLNDSGEFIWSLLSEGKSLDEIVDAMCKEYDAPRDLIKTDVEEYVGVLSAHGFIAND